MDNIPSIQDWEKALTERHGNSLQNRLQQSTIAICGLGGLGSNIAINLARMGIGSLILIDFDQVDLSNLHRQQYKVSQIGMPKTEALKQNLLEIAPYANLHTYTCKVDERNYKELLVSADIICEAFDCPESKAMLVNQVLETFPNKYIVSASGMAGIGSANEIRTRQITPHFILCGDETSDINEGIGLVAPRVMLCAAHQALAVVRIISGETTF